MSPNIVVDFARYLWICAILTTPLWSPADLPKTFEITKKLLMKCSNLWWLKLKKESMKNWWKRTMVNLGLSTRLMLKRKLSNWLKCHNFQEENTCMISRYKLSKLIKNRQNISKVVRSCQNASKRQKLSKSFKNRRNLSMLIQNCRKPSKFLEIC